MKLDELNQLIDETNKHLTGRIFNHVTQEEITNYNEDYNADNTSQKITIKSQELKTLLQLAIVGDMDGLISHPYAIAQRAYANGATKEGKAIEEAIKASFDTRIDYIKKIKEISRIELEKSKESSDHQNPIHHDIEMEPEEDEILETIEKPQKKLSEVYLEPDFRKICEELIKDQQHIEEYQENNISPIHKVLLAGPPGNGKTTLAGALARELNRPLKVLRLDTIVNCHIGVTSRRLKKALEDVANKPSVLLLDEFEFMANDRTADKEDTEFHRITAGLLNSIENLPAQVLLVAATNQPEMLDHAMWRRFDIVSELKAPSRKALQAFLEKLWPYVEDYTNTTPKEVVASFRKFSCFADVEALITDARRVRILYPETKDIVKEAIKRYSRLSNGFKMFGTQHDIGGTPSETEILEVIETPKKNLSEVFLDENFRITCEEVIKEQRDIENLQEIEDPPRHKMLLFGPPGNGKTTLAGAMAKELNRPLKVLRLNSVLNAHLGESARRLKTAIDDVSREPSVLLLDEFDFVANERSIDPWDSEMHRVTDTLLVQIEKISEEVLLIAATNHPHMLDEAFKRRFDIIKELRAPTKEAVQAFLEKLWNTVGSYTKTTPEEVANKLPEDISFSEVEALIIDAKRVRRLYPNTEDIMIEALQRRANNDDLPHLPI